MEFNLNNLDNDSIKKIIGVNDCNIKLLEDLYGCGTVYRNDSLKILSDDEKITSKFNKHLQLIVNSLNTNDIDYDFIKQSFFDINNSLDIDYKNEIITTSYNGKPFKCKTFNQYKFVKALKNNDLIFSVGPAGTGKTFLAVLLAINSLRKGETNKIIITRPAVEAGESLGFLPGDLKDKINPYLMPIYDALDLIVGSEQKDKYIEKGIIEIMPLAYMRGRTLNEAFIILDEAQNATDKQMLMFLTRLGFNSKMIVNGDITQIDLNISKNNSGLVKAIDRLKNVNGVSFITFNNTDVVRNPLVQTIIEKFII